MTRSLNGTPNGECRILSFEGGCNFRDLGGYRSRDGRALRWGKVYRTGVLSYFTDRDYELLKTLGVRAICDLRRAEEREREPARWPDTNTRHLNWDDGASPPTVRMFAAQHPNTAAGMRLVMIDLYRALVAWMAPRLRGMFERITEGDVPLIVHCAAGKDRTGIAIALLLTALDVPYETIVEDYLLTNEAGDFEQFILSRHQTQLGLATTNHPLLALPEDVRRVLFAADPDYLNASFEQIASEFGNAQTFIRNEIGIDSVLQRKLETALLSN
jgi:protein-tyrosine phosphatase